MNLETHSGRLLKTDSNLVIHSKGYHDGGHRKVIGINYRAYRHFAGWSSDWKIEGSP
ncbi:hypothetical protein [Paenibacillus silviterrae]|uniref:hypothetical protein n=1 Tax=Paenibacillus silviterrae TaxID=3242194 RepID=UPI002543F02F|nr:hypothetical protein [Paenibacillus chinjuensis]